MISTQIKKISVDDPIEDIIYLKKTFTHQEINYSKTKRYPIQHLHGILCAKKAINRCLPKKHLMKDIEIMHEINGKPVAFINNIRFDGDISISHTDMLAAAIAVTNL